VPSQSSGMVARPCPPERCPSPLSLIMVTVGCYGLAEGVQCQDGPSWELLSEIAVLLVDMDKCVSSCHCLPMDRLEISCCGSGISTVLRSELEPV
jgi:hypothetical protein